MFSPAIADAGVLSPYEAEIGLATGGDPQLTALTRAVISVESGWNPGALNPWPPGGESYGLMQINARAHGRTPADLFIPAVNIELGVSILRDQLARRPTLNLAIAAYNAGTERTDADLQERIDRNLNGVGSYVNDVLTYYTFYLNRQEGTLLPPTGPTVIPSWLSDSLVWVILAVGAGALVGRRGV